jgi:hypothetical protein
MVEGASGIGGTMVYPAQATAQAAAKGAVLSQIELRVADGRLQRCARHRLHELTLFEIELLHLEVALGGERLPLAIDAVLADVRR